jgi:hypothetical protein
LGARASARINVHLQGRVQAALGQSYQSHWNFLPNSRACSDIK